MKIMIAIPAQDLMHTGFVQSLLGLKIPEGAQIRYGMVMNSLVYEARNALAAQAVKEECDYVLWLDSDMTFGPDLLNDLLADDKDIVAGIFFRRRPPFNPCIYKTLRADREFPERNAHEQYDDYPKDTLFEVEGVGMAAVLVKIDVFRKITLNEYKGHSVAPPFVPLLGYGEDLSFCIRAREAGCEVWCDSRVKVGHMASVVVDEKAWEAQKQ